MMATLEDEHTDAATHDIPDALTPAQRQSPGPMLHDVYQELEGGTLEPIASAVEVKARGLAGRQEAISKGTADLDEHARYGTFRVVKHGEMSDPITREQKTEPVDVWS
jgi:hypothetical protein